MRWLRFSAALALFAQDSVARPRFEAFPGELPLGTTAGRGKSLVIRTTASSPVRVLSASELGRYLDYCSELQKITLLDWTPS